MVKDYKNTVIYKLICNDTSITDSYVGHTTDFHVRRGCHKTCCHNQKSEAYNFAVYKFIRTNGGWENFTMIELCKYPCNSAREAELEERRFIELLNCTLNKQKPTRSQKEWREDNKEYNKEYKKEWYENNKQKIAEQGKKYNTDNKEKITAYKKEWYNTNKDKINSKITCDCGCVIVRGNLSAHKKTKKHLKLIKLKI